MKRAIFAVIGLGFCFAWVAIGQTILGWQDWVKMSAPGSNPASGYMRMWADSSSGMFKCLTSSGASCFFDPGSTVSGTNNTVTKFTSSTTVGNSGLTDNGTTIATTEQVDLSGATWMKIPIAAGASAGANGKIAYDTTNNMLHVAQSGADAFVAQFTLTPGANGNCVQWLKSGSTFKLGDAGGPCGTTTGSGGGITAYSAAATSFAGTAYLPISGGAALNTTEANVQSAAPSTATISNLYVQVSAALGVGNSAVFTWRDGGVDQTLTCTISGASATSCNDSAHSFTAAAGDLVDVKVVTTGAPTAVSVTLTSAFGTTGVGVTSVSATSPVTSTGGTTPTIACPSCLNGTPTNHATAIGGSTQTLSYVGPGTTGQVLTSNGPSADPTFKAGTGTTPVAFASIPACSTTAAFYQLTNSIYSAAYCNGSSALSYFYGGQQLTPPTGFAWQNQSTATLTTTNGGENIVSAVGATAANVNGRYVAYPAAPFSRTLAARIKSYVTNTTLPTDDTGGIYISDGTKVITFGLTGGGTAVTPSLTLQSGPAMTNINTQVSNTGKWVSQADLIYLRFADGLTCTGATSTGNRYYCYSYDDVNFFQFYTEANSVTLTATQIGYYAYAYDSGTYTTMWAAGWQ